MKYVLIIGLALSSVLLLALWLHKEPARRTGQTRIDRQFGNRPPDHVQILRSDAWHAADKGDLAGAEQLYKQALAEQPNDLMAYRSLAALYDKIGRDRDAMLAWGKDIYGVGGAISSDGNDPVVLTHYADLCREFGKTSEANAIYLKVVNRKSYIGDEYAIHVNSDTSSNVLRAYAHVVAGFERLSYGKKSESITDFELAMALCPSLPIIHVGYALGLYYTGMFNEARYQFWKAQKLADGDLAAAIEKTRSNYNYLYQDIQVHGYVGGRIDVKRVPYDPKTAKPIPDRPLRESKAIKFP